MMHKKTIFSGLVLTALSFSSCSEYSLMDDEAIRMGLFGEEYSENFENAYGKIAPDQTWDFSSYNLHRLGLAGGPGAAMTRATNPNQTNYTGKTDATSADKSAILAGSQTPVGFSSDAMTDGYYNVQSATFSWLDTNLPEGEQNPLNVTNGQPFVLGKPQQNFAIIPIYQGHAGMCWDLHLVDKATNKDYTLWSKSEGIRYYVDFSKTVQIEVGRDDITEYDVENHKDVISFDNIYFEDYDRNGDLEFTITLPANRDLKGKFVNQTGNVLWNISNLPDGCSVSSYDAGGNTEWEYFFNNKDNSSPKSFTLKFSQDSEKDWIQGKGIKFYIHQNWVTWDDTNFYSCNFNDKNNLVTASVKYNATKWINLQTANNGNPELSNEAGHTVNREAVQAKPIVIDGSKISGDMYLYLKITREDPDNGGESGYGKLGACQRSDEYMMVALPCTQPTNIESSQAMIIGCEDSNTALSDWDVNDIVFLLVGQGELPDVQEVVAAKRYMIEDLGSTFDFDFNDIVVDVTQYRVKDYKGDVKSTKTIASLKHLCGTIPFQIKIGNTTLGGENKKYPGCNANSAQGGSGCDPTKCSDHFEEYKSAIDCVVEGWDPSANNITVTTWPKEAGWNDAGNADYLGEKGSQTFGFPDTGEFPYIIACDQTVNWMAEQVSVPRNWFKTWPANYDKWPNHSQDTPQQGGGTSIFTYSGNPSDYTATYESGGDFVKINLGTVLQNKGVTKVKVQSTTAITGAAFGCSYNEWKETEVSVTAGETKEITLSSGILEQINAGGDLYLQIYQDPSGFNFNGLKITIDKK